MRESAKKVIDSGLKMAFEIILQDCLLMTVINS